MSEPFDKKTLSETDIRTKYITPAIVKAGWSSFSQMREEYPITKGRIIARGKTCKRDKPLKADYDIALNSINLKQIENPAALFPSR